MSSKLLFITLRYSDCVRLNNGRAGSFTVLERRGEQIKAKQDCRQKNHIDQMLHLAELSLTVGVGKNVQVYSKLYIKVKFRNNLL